MVCALARALDHRLIERDELIQLMDRVGRAPIARNGYAHKPWLLAAGKLYQLDEPAMPIEKSKKHRVTTKQLDKDIAILRTLHGDLKQFVVQFANKYPLQLEPQVSRMPQPWPGKLPLQIPRLKT
jgi:hypothetical protein